jgi:hypothetical protein
LGCHGASMITIKAQNLDGSHIGHPIEFVLSFTNEDNDTTETFVAGRLAYVVRYSTGGEPINVQLDAVAESGGVLKPIRHSVPIDADITVHGIDQPARGGLRA